MWSNQEHKHQGNKYLCSRLAMRIWICGIISFQRIHFGVASKHGAAGREKGVKEGSAQGSLPWAVGRMFEDGTFMSFIAKLDLWGYESETPGTSPEKALSLMIGFSACTCA